MVFEGVVFFGEVLPDFFIATGVPPRPGARSLRNVNEIRKIFSEARSAPGSPELAEGEGARPQAQSVNEISVFNEM